MINAILDRWAWRRIAQRLVTEMTIEEADRAFEQCLKRPTLSYDAETIHGAIVPREEIVRSLLTQALIERGPIVLAT